MTERAPGTSRRPSRWSPARIRAAAWLAGGATVLASGAALAVAPVPAAGSTTRKPQRKPAPAPKVIERHVTRRIVVIDAAPVAAAPVSAPTVVVQAPAAAPAPTTTGGS